MTTRPATVNFHLYQHATFSETQVLRDADDNPIDLTGYRARMQVRRERADADTLFDLDSDFDDIVLGGTDGSITLTLTHQQTGAVSLVDPDGETWAHDILLTDDSTPPNVDRIYQGVIFVHPGVTRPA